MMEGSNFDFRYVRLYDLDIPREKLLNDLQTVETLIYENMLRVLNRNASERHVLRRSFV